MGLLPVIILVGHVHSQSMGSNMGLGFNMGHGYPVVNPFLPGLGGGFNIFSGMNRNVEPRSPYVEQVSSNCRLVEVKEFEGRTIDDYKKCVDIKMMAYNWIIEEMEPQGGACRWRGGVRPGEETEGRRGACLCPATTEELCMKDRPGCFFHTDRKSKESTCISKPERFYNQLARLLAKRGKRDFSMKIQYGASGALGYLPVGLQGPAMIGRGNPYLGHHDASHFGTFGSQGVGSFGFAPNYEYRTGQGFGGFGGYGPHGNYSQGAAAWGNPSPPFYTQFNPAMGYGYYQPAFPSPTATPESNSQAADEGQEEERDGRDGHQPQGTQPTSAAQPPMYGSQTQQHGGMHQQRQLFPQQYRTFGQYSGMQAPMMYPGLYHPAPVQHQPAATPATEGGA